MFAFRFDYLRKFKIYLSLCSIIHFLFSFLLLHVVDCQNALKVCTKDGKVHQMGTETCERGAWSPDSLNVDCVCVRGLWVLSENFCDKEYFIFTGRENDCFKVNRPIRRFVSLMNNEDLGSGRSYYFRGELESFKPFTGNLSLASKSIPGPGETSFILRYNDTENSMYLRHEEGVPSKFWQRCYEPIQGEETFQIVKTDGASFLSAHGAGKNCEALRDLKFGFGSNKKTVWSLGMGSGWHSKYGLENISKKCQKSCGGKSSRSGRSPTKKGDKKLNQTTKAGPTLEKNIFDNTVTGDDEIVELTLGEDEKEFNNQDYGVEGQAGYDSADSDVMTEHLRDNGRDTVRMANHLKKWIFHNIPGPIVAQKEFQYLQLARIVFLKSCPDVDGHSLTNFFRLFRFLVYESLKKFPESYPENTEDAIHSRIVNTMRKCFGNVTPYKVKLEMNPCADLGDDENSSVSGVKVISITDAKGVSYSPKINATLEDDVSFKTGLDSDSVLETVWKLMLHAHYQCAEEFRDHPQDLSWMYIKLQEFLTNPHIIFRWENPGQYLNKVYAFMHPGFKLGKFAKTVDACVSAAKESSLFEEWMQRPKKQRDFQSASVSKRSMVLLGAQDEGKPTLFQGKGYCVNKFEDPITWTHFNPGVNAKCN